MAVALSWVWPSAPRVVDSGASCGATGTVNAATDPAMAARARSPVINWIWVRSESLSPEIVRIGSAPPVTRSPASPSRITIWRSRNAGGWSGAAAAASRRRMSKATG